MTSEFIKWFSKILNSGNIVGAYFYNPKKKDFQNYWKQDLNIQFVQLSALMRHFNVTYREYRYPSSLKLNARNKKLFILHEYFKN